MEITPIIGWSQITLDKAVKVLSIEMPKNLRAFYLSDEEGQAKIEAELTDFELVKELPTYYGKVLEVLYDIPPSFMDTVGREERKVLYEGLCMYWVTRLLVGDYQDVQELKEFEHKGITYKMPTARELYGVTKEGVDLKAFQFTEAADIEINSKMLANGNYEHTAAFIAMLCYPYQRYDEAKAIELSKQLTDLPMSIVWNVFFSILNFGAQLSAFTLTSLKSKALGLERRVKVKA